MGTITNFPISSIRSSRGLDVFVEAGTWLGDAVQHALECGFVEAHSIEAKLEFAEQAAARFAEAPVTIWHGNTIEVLPRLLPSIERKTALWWLDAHLQDFYGISLEAFHPLPLEAELNILSTARDITGDVFIIDDLRIYEDIPTDQNWPERIEYAKYGNDGIEFIFNLLGRTHIVERDFRDQGYVVALPRAK
jgi:hypothetical protein